MKQDILEIIIVFCLVVVTEVVIVFFPFQTIQNGNPNELV